MIVLPSRWETRGQIPSLDDIEGALVSVLCDINCNHLAYSGGIDSTLLLHYLEQIYGNVYTYTIGYSLSHPDIIYAQRYLYGKHNIYSHFHIPSEELIKENKYHGDYPGDESLRIFYGWVKYHTQQIITGDGIDEYSCGYYDHMTSSGEDIYRDYLSRLVTEHLVPLDKLSGDVEAFLPYIDERMVSLWEAIPLSAKCTPTDRKLVVKALALRAGIDIDIIERRKYGLCSSLNNIKEASSERCKTR